MVASAVASAQCMKEFDISACSDEPQKLRDAVEDWCTPWRWSCSQPFLVGWYNQKRRETAGGSSLIDAPDDTLALALYSIPGYLDVISEYYARVCPKDKFIDNTTDDILDRLKKSLCPELDALMINTDTGPPYYHIQTIGAVAGVDQHLEADEFELEDWSADLSEGLFETRDRKMWGEDPETLRKIFGVNVHPVFGGWYAYRALIVFRGVTTSKLTAPDPLNFVAPDDARRILYEFNLQHEHCRWRDLCATGLDHKLRYTPDEYLFFTEKSNEKRRRYLELRASQFAATPEPRR